MQVAMVGRLVGCRYHMYRNQRGSGAPLWFCWIFGAVRKGQLCASLDGVGSFIVFTIEGGTSRLLGSGLAGAKMATSGRFLLMSSRLEAWVGACVDEGALGSKS